MAVFTEKALRCPGCGCEGKLNSSYNKHRRRLTHKCGCECFTTAECDDAELAVSQFNLRVVKEFTMTASRRFVLLDQPVASESAPSRHDHLRAVTEDAKSYTIEDLNVSHALILENLEEYEERISRIENCMMDLCLALRGALHDMDFSKLKKSTEAKPGKEVRSS